MKNLDNEETSRLTHKLNDCAEIVVTENDGYSTAILFNVCEVMDSKYDGELISEEIETTVYMFNDVGEQSVD